MFYPAPWVAAVRITQWCRYLPQFGWRPTVLCRHYGQTATRELLDQHVHRDVTVEYFNPPQSADPPPDPNPAKAKGRPSRQWLQKYLEWASVPDTSIFFWRSAKTRATAMRAVHATQPHAILTTCPPHSNHDIGLWLSRQTDIPWVADFRDPYVIDPRYQLSGIGGMLWPLHRRYEAAIYRHASLTVHAIPVQTRWARLAYPDARQRIKTLTNGCPPQLAEGRVDPDRSSNGRRSVRVVGMIADDGAIKLAEAIDSLVAGGEDLELRLVGYPTKVEGQLKATLGDRVIITGLVPHDQALRQIAGADVLICYLDMERARNLLLSSKLFEYLATGKPTLVINPTLPDRQLLRRVPFARVLHQPQTKQVADAIRDALQTDDLPADQIDTYRQQFSRRAQTRQLSQWLDELVSHLPRPGRESRV